MIPKNYMEWRQCIEHDCGIKITPEFIEKRLNAFNDKKDLHTQRFVALYGNDHLQNVLKWLKQTQQQISQPV
jgi:hypothetical protein